MLNPLEKGFPLMAVRLTRPGKHTLIVESPLLPMAGTIGFGDEYAGLLNLNAFGALVTNPVTTAPRSPANGARVIPLAAGMLMHTGLPNPGLRVVLGDMAEVWARLALPVIVHFVPVSLEDLRRALGRLDEADHVAAVEIGLNDDIPQADAVMLTREAGKTEKPALIRLPFGAPMAMVRAVADAGADALVLSAPPRGTARDAAGHLVSGRIYGPMNKPLALRHVGQAAQLSNAPVIAAGGIHTPDDARDFLEAGAVAVQIDSLVWVQPDCVPAIAEALAGPIAPAAQPSDPADGWPPG
jgi:dihydroorotate dehydrogenase (NAD+) catalytic subunit